MTASAVLRYWLEDGLESGWPSRDLGQLWFGGAAAVDAEIRTRFGGLVQQAVAGGLVDWEATAADSLALVLLLDQFARNVFRGQPLAFAGDARAQRIAAATVERGEDRGLPLVGRVFLGMPWMHAENLALQDRCVRYLESLLAQAPPEHAQAVQGHLDAACEHRAIIAGFGRFPHRNAALGRTSTDQERRYLETGKRFGQ